MKTVGLLLLAYYLKCGTSAPLSSPKVPGKPHSLRPKARQVAAPADVFPDKSMGIVVLDLPTATPIAPPGSSGALYGGENLLGYDANPIDQADSAVVQNPEMVQGQDADSTEGLYLDFSGEDDPQPIRGHVGKSGGTDNGPDTSRYSRLNSDVFAPPGTDTGGIPNAQWPLGLSSNRLGLDNAGWARQQNMQQLPRALEMAGVDMKLMPNAYRELHWHQAGEWSYIFKGSVRVALVNENGETFVDDLNAGDVWFFPPGVPHSIQAHSEGAEFLLIFDDGSFSEDDTSLITEMFLRNPRAVLAKNLKADISALDDIPQDELYIFPGTPAPDDIEAQNVTGPAGATAQLNTQYTYHFSQQQPLEIPMAGSVKIVDPTTFPAAADISAALLTIEPGAMRELHWHPQSDEWNFFLEGSARITIYQAPDMSQTFDYGAGDIGYIPMTFSHYIENTGNETLTLLEVLKAPKFTDISVAQWLGLTPQQIVKDHLHLPESVMNNLPKYKPYLISGPPNLTSTNFTGSF